MRKKLSTLLMLILSASASAQAEPHKNGLLEQIGYAYELDSGEFIYTEHHYQLFRDGSIVDHHVEYRGPDGAALATKTLDYSTHPYAPDFELRDWRDGYVEAGVHIDQGYRLKRRKQENDEFSTEVVPRPDELELVADSGFDRYVKTVLPNVLDQERQTFVMAVAGRLSSFTFEARLVERRQLFDRPAVLIKVQPASLLRLLTGGIDITYDLENGYLLRYEGISNIRDENGDRYDARIDFPPEERRFTPIGEPEPGNRTPADTAV